MTIADRVKNLALNHIAVEPNEVRTNVTRWLGESHGDKDGARQKATAHYAFEAAKTGFVTGLMPGVLASLVASIFDAKGVAKQRAGLTAAYGLLADPQFFDHPDYPLLIARSLSEGDVARAEDLEEESWASTAVRFHATAYIARAARRSGLRWLGKRFLGGVPGLVVPVVGGVIGGAWNYAELRVVAMRYNNDPEPIAHGPREQPSQVSPVAPAPPTVASKSVVPPAVGSPSNPKPSAQP